MSKKKTPPWYGLSLGPGGQRREEEGGERAEKMGRQGHVRTRQSVDDFFFFFVRLSLSNTLSWVNISPTAYYTGVL
jgi:hypothetical protein